MNFRKVDYGGTILREVDAGIRNGKRRRFYRKTRREAEAVAKDLGSDDKQLGRMWGKRSSRKLAKTHWEKYGITGLTLS